ncbi:MAG TPA: chemotaxis-specific protein-glutamate methyltransferase CheB [Treponemataceae bacterium]|nr:chemotaxis-specific protein-glutamate methyltransferase CheB [Treponemataceae bacterium]HPS42935.1 chemotaxis-specific protein-glutamate methyltransferase CheB [Treponemataceae bacterium]
MTAAKRVRVLIVDDSAIARDMLERGLSRQTDIEVVGKASDAYSARDRIVLLSPDVVTLDIEMPGMNGIEFLKRLIPQYPVPVVVVSAVTAEGSRMALEALEAGAVDVVAKPGSRTAGDTETMIENLAEAVREAAVADMKKFLTLSSEKRKGVAKRPHAHERQESANGNERRIIAIGASTGGTNALDMIIPRFPAETPGIVIVQHMPPVFTRMFAQSLDRASDLEVREAADGDRVRQGLALVAPGGLHMTVHEDSSGWFVRCREGAKVSGHCPSVDVLFSSVAETAGERATGLILTGMGRDGADGLLAMRKAGARCFAQDEQSSVVYGMPKEAWENGAAERKVPIEMATHVVLAASAPRLKIGSL